LSDPPAILQPTTTNQRKVTNVKSNHSKGGNTKGNQGFGNKVSNNQDEKSREKWKKEVQDFAIANIKKAENFRTNYRSWNNSLNVDFDLIVKESDFPKEPERDFTVMHQHSYNEIVEDITNALTILKMTDEETVNASTMKQIAKYL